MQAYFERHERVALQFSGGKDSLATLYLMKPWWDRITVYWLDAGDGFPETYEIVERVRREVPHFVCVQSSCEKVIAEHGIPTDLMPATHTEFGHKLFGTAEKFQDRLTCCWRSVMLPMHERMKRDGITLIIRGQKDADIGWMIRSGHIEDGVEYLFPLQDWSKDDVFAYLRENDLPINAVYETMDTTPECMTCSAWWDDNRAQYMKSRYPAKYEKYQSRLARIRVAVAPLIAEFNREVK
jgi:3'-phosphoadenosine 5'-phosphosulfate sulfotransferase (PAPS reductase)/FAD synthetase